jgi:hypothetical protein
MGHRGAGGRGDRPDRRGRRDRIRQRQRQLDNDYVLVVDHGADDDHNADHDGDDHHADDDNVDHHAHDHHVDHHNDDIDDHDVDQGQREWQRRHLAVGAGCSSASRSRPRRGRWK